jgi:transcription antitermination factor NusG
MFIEVDLAQVGESTFRWMPFSRGLVWVGGEPGRISDPIVSALKAQIELLEQDGAELEQRYRKGELVRICGGPFEGYQAIFDVMVPGKHRVRVLLKILNDRYFPAELDASSLM